MGSWLLDLKYGRTYCSYQAISLTRKTDSTQTANQNSKSRLLINSQVASLADDLPFDGAFLFSDDPLAYIG